MYTTLLFDLDGTLTESAPGITNSVAYALEKFGIRVEDRSELLRFVGPPLGLSFERFYGLTPEQAEQAIVWYRQYFTAGGMFENAVYDRIRETLQTLKEAGKTLCVATAKPQLFAEKILRHFGLFDFFDAVYGASMDESRNTKAGVIEWCLRSQGTDTSGVVMIGDRSDDVLGAHANGLPCIGVLWGYGSREELTGAGAELLAETPEALPELVL